MNLETLSQKKPAAIGFLQFLCGFTYIALIATFFQIMKYVNFQPPEFLAALTMITLFVFSATMMGVIFLGMPAYLAMKSNWTKALAILGFTLVYSFAAILLLLVISLTIFR